MLQSGSSALAARPLQAGVQEQVRGMKVRSSVKKLCEGCKVCLRVSFLFFSRSFDIGVWKVEGKVSFMNSGSGGFSFGEDGILRDSTLC